MIIFKDSICDMMPYFCDLVDWYAQIAREEARTVHIVPPNASQKAIPISQPPPNTNGRDSSQYF